MIVEELEQTNTPEPVKNIPLLRRPAVYRLVVVALLAEIGYAVMNISAMGPFLLIDRHMTQAEAAWVLSAFLLSEALSKGPMGHLADRYGRKAFMMIGPLLSVGTAIVSIAIPRGLGTAGVFAYMGLRVFDGIGLGMLWPAAYATLSEIVADEDRQLGMSYLNLCYMLGAALAFPIGGMVNDAFHSFRASFWLAAGMFVCVAAAVYFLIPSTTSSGTKVVHEGEEALSLKELLAAVARNPVYVLLAFLTFMGVGAPMLVIKILPMKVLHLSESEVGFLVFPVAVGMAGLNGPITRFGKKLGRMRSVHVGLGACAIGMSVVASGLFLPFLRSPLVLAIGAIPVGLGFVLAIPAWYAAVSDLDPLNRGINIGMIMTGQGLGAIVGNLTGSYLSEKLAFLSPPGDGVAFSNYMPFACSAVFITIGWLIGLKVLREPSSPKALDAA